MVDCTSCEFYECDPEFNLNYCELSFKSIDNPQEDFCEFYKAAIAAE